MSSLFPASDSPPPRPPERLGGRYRLLEAIGRGAMASVYKVHDERTGESLAVKIPDPRVLADPTHRARFEGEARALRALDHPHVVAVYDSGEEAGFSYLVMELCEGGSLGGWVERHGPLPPRLAVGMVAAAADGVREAHEYGIVHRDLKPANLLMTIDGRLKVADFGIARFEVGDAQHSHTGESIGTLGYMAPEQREDGRGATPTSDVYGLAATLYSLLTDRIQLDLFAMSFRPELLDGIPGPLQDVLIRALAYDPAERTRTAKAFCEDLRRLLGRLPPDPKHPPLVVPPRSSVPLIPRLTRPSLSIPAGIPRKRTALVLDHDLRSQRWLRQQLEEEGVQVLVAADAAEAVRAVEGHRGFVDVALVDVILASEGAFEDVQASRPGIPVIYTSSLSTSSSLFGAHLPSGGIIRKPCARDELLGAISRAILPSEAS